MSFAKFSRMEAGGEVENRLNISGPIEPSRPWWDYEKEEALAAADEFREALDAIEGEKLTVIIDSDGGDLGAGLTMYNALRQRKGETRCEIWHAYSAATLPMAACRDGRLISPTGTLLIHNPATWASGDHREMEKARVFLDKMKAAAIAAYAEATGKDAGELAEMMDRETVMTAQEAIDSGFADGLIETAGDAAKVAAKAAVAASMAATQASVDRLLKERTDAAEKREQEERERIAAWAEALP